MNKTYNMKDFRSYPVNLTEDQYAAAIVRFLECPYYYMPEVTIFNAKSSGRPRPGYLFPDDAIYVSYSKDKIPSKEQVVEDLSKNHFAFNGVAALDENDEERIIFSSPGKMMPEFKGKVAINTYSKVDPILMNKIIKYLEKE